MEKPLLVTEDLPWAGAEAGAQQRETTGALGCSGQQMVHRWPRVLGFRLCSCGAAWGLYKSDQVSIRAHCVYIPQPDDLESMLEPKPPLNPLLEPALEAEPQPIAAPELEPPALMPGQATSAAKSQAPMLTKQHQVRSTRSPHAPGNWAVTVESSTVPSSSEGISMGSSFSSSVTRIYSDIFAGSD
ncbi:hypothetical protein QYF61_023414 [Mycteria americana]|uniref:Uncharacterized protein n=1 Tax=Mycteria americana TaxID=33587 RepID=A0AAN7RMP5_MYCAM|nr:hypothetical protein QYF61_023414 [Mycteria americana]